MLHKFRKLSNNLISKILLAFIVVILAISLGGNFISSPSNYAVKVGNIKVSQTDFDKYIQLNLMQLGAQGVNIDDIPPAIVKNLLTRKLVEEKLMQAFLEDYGIRLSNKLVYQNLSRDEAFIGEDGKFSEDKLHNYLQYVNLTEQQFFNHYRQNMYRHLFTNLIFGHFAAPSSFNKQLYTYLNTEFETELYQINFPTEVKNAAVPQEAINNYYEEHKEEFTWPEYRQVEYVVINQIDQQKLLDDIEDALAGGETLANIATKFSLEHKKLPYFTYNLSDENNKPIELPEAKFADSIFALNQGEDTGFLLGEDQQKFYLFVVTDIKAQKNKSLQEANDEIKTILANEQKTTKINEFVDQINQGITSKPLEELKTQYTPTIKQVKLKRAKVEATVNVELQKQLFELNPGEMTVAVAGSNGVEFAKLVKVKRVSQPKSAELEALDNQNRQKYQQDVYERVMEYLTEQYPVKIYE